MQKSSAKALFTRASAAYGIAVVLVRGERPPGRERPVALAAALAEQPRVERGSSRPGSAAQYEQTERERQQRHLDRLDRRQQQQLR